MSLSLSLNFCSNDPWNRVNIMARLGKSKRVMVTSSAALAADGRLLLQMLAPQT